MFERTEQEKNEVVDAIVHSLEIAMNRSFIVRLRFRQDWSLNYELSLKQI